jgi:hypothetical protein
MIGKVIRAVVPAKYRPVTYLINQAYRETGGKVRQGPFAGMNYINQAFYSAYIPKLLGIYERELNGAIAEICHIKPTKVIDIGAAEGYYAVGLALLLPDSRVLAYEMTKQGQTLLREMCKINGVSARVDVRGRCDRVELENVLSDGQSALVVCDCEGFESILLDPLRVPSLRFASVLVESHDCFLPGLKEELADRFEATHDIKMIASTERYADEYPFTSTYVRALPKSYRAWAVGEWRPEVMYWLWMKPKENSGASH